MKKALLIHPRLSRSGGLEICLLDYCDYFLDQGWEVHIACRRAEADLIKPGMVIHKFSSLFTNKHNKNDKFNKKLEKWNKPAFDFELSMGRTTIQKNILAPATHQGYLRGTERKTITKDDQRYIEMDQAGYNASKNIFAVSNKIKTELLSHYKVPQEKITVLYPALNLKNHQQYNESEKAAIRKEYKLDPSKIYHLFVSTSHNLKGLSLLNTVFGRLKGTPHTLLVIGSSFQSSLPNVISMGYFKDVSKAYALGDYLLHPTQYDSFAMVVSEALHHQVPVIVSPNAGATEILNDQLGIIAPNRHVETWVEIIEGLSKREFIIPATLIKDLGLDLNSHMGKMLAVDKS